MAVRLGLIGAGRWGRNYIRTLVGLDDPGIRLVRIADPDPAVAALAPAGCALTPDWRAVAEAADLDGVIIATPPATHAAIAGAAIERGLPVLIEKPLTLDPAEAGALRRLATERGVAVMVDHIHLYNAAFRALAARSARLGPPLGLLAQAGNRGPYRADCPTLWDWGPHDVAMALRLAGADPGAVSGRRLESATVEPGRIAENLELGLDFGGWRAVCVVGTAMDRRRRLAVFHETEVLLYDDLAPIRLTRHPWRGRVAWPDGEGEPIDAPGPQPLAAVTRTFAEVAAGVRPADDGLDLGVRVVEVLDRAARDMAV